VTPADLILIHNCLVEAIAKAELVDINDEYDLWASLSTLKDGFLKYCKAYDHRLRNVLQDIRVIAEDEEESTVVAIKGIILAWKSRVPMSKQTFSEMSVETQFLIADKAQYLELSQDFASISFSPKSKTALENMKMLVMLDLKILLGADISWSKPVCAAASAGNGSSAAASGKGDLASIPVLSEGRCNDDADVSSEDGIAPLVRKEAAAKAAAAKTGAAAAATRAPGQATAATAAVDAQTAKAADAAASKEEEEEATSRGGDSAVDAQKAKAAGAAASEAAAAAAATSRGSDIEIALDDFTTWTHETWNLLDLSKVSFPPEKPVVHIKNHYALALLFCHSKSLREKYPECYKALCTACQSLGGTLL
jgi:hypothetical protein